MGAIGRPVPRHPNRFNDPQHKMATGQGKTLKSNSSYVFTYFHKHFPHQNLPLLGHFFLLQRIQTLDNTSALSRSASTQLQGAPAAGVVGSHAEVSQPAPANTSQLGGLSDSLPKRTENRVQLGFTELQFHYGSW